jgi:hypothetical protein
MRDKAGVDHGFTPAFLFSELEIIDGKEISGTHDTIGKENVLFFMS